jgi:flagellar hook protein FlgE
VIPPGSTDVSVGQDGNVSYLNPATNTRAIAGYLSMATFANQSGLERQGNSLWTATANSGTEVVNTPGVGGAGATIAGELEMSNVDLATQFTTMITAQRGFQANSRVITTADQMLQELVNMKQ